MNTSLPKIFILTACTRPYNLPKLLESFPTERIQWIIVFDPTVKDPVEMENAIHLTSPMTGQYGNYARNTGLNYLYDSGIITDQDWLYILDDDNIIHPDWWENVKDNLTNNTLITWGQHWHKGYHRADATNTPASGNIDTAQYMVRWDIAKNFKFRLQYEADGFYAEDCFNFTGSCLAIQKDLCYYNYLRSNKMGHEILAKIVMTTMFKNESKVIRRMLESCYKYIDFYVIQNNGSTDGTQEIVEDFFKDKNIPGVIYKCEEGWKGFGWNRDHLIQYTQKTDHGCDWILKMDCDEILEVDDDFNWAPLFNHAHHSFHITAQQGNSIYYRAWIWNARMNWRFNHDPCHETIYTTDNDLGENFDRYDLPNKIRQIGFPEGQSWSNPTKFISDALILEEKMIKENSILTDLYHFWYIGKSYNDAHQNPSFPLGESQQKEFSRRCIYYFKEYLNTTHDFSNTKTPKGIHEMAYMAMVLIGENQKFIGEVDNAIETFILAEGFAPARNDHLVPLAVIYEELGHYDKMLEITTRLVHPDRKNPFPAYYMMIDSSVYIDSPSNRVQDLHDRALSNMKTTTLPQIFTFMINKSSNKKLFVVDNFYSNPDEIRQYALGVEFTEDLRFYKGSRSALAYHPPGIVESFESIMGQKIVNFDTNMPNGCFQITTSFDPQVYHHDLQKWAAMIYLTPNAPIESGTRLIRSKFNKAGHINDPGINMAFEGGFLDSTKFEVVDSAANMYNRLVIMDAQSIHSAGPYFGKTKEDGRLTHLFFFD